MWRVWCVAAVAAGGCGGRPDGFHPVGGAVTVAGAPLRTGTVTFRPDAAKGNATQHHPTGAVAADGTYTLYTVGKAGAPPGWYRVLVFADGNPKPAPGTPPQWLHHVKYTTERTTDLSVEVVADPPPGRYDLKLTR